MKKFSVLTIILFIFSVIYTIDTYRSIYNTKTKYSEEINKINDDLLYDTLDSINILRKANTVLFIDLCTELLEKKTENGSISYFIVKKENKVVAYLPNNIDVNKLNYSNKEYGVIQDYGNNKVINTKYKNYTLSFGYAYKKNSHITTLLDSTVLKILGKEILITIFILYLILVYALKDMLKLIRTVTARDRKY